MIGNSPCASCKLLKRRCAKDCIFAPYFPSDDPQKFAIVHKVFGASNVSKMLQELPVEKRGDTVSSLVYEANARVRDPVYGCVGAISYLQNQVSELQMQLAVAEAEILCIQMQQDQEQYPNHNSDHSNNNSFLSNQTLLGINPHDHEHDHDHDHSQKIDINGHHAHLQESYFLQTNLPAQCLNFASTSTSSNINHVSFNRDSFFGHDMVS